MNYDLCCLPDDFAKIQPQKRVVKCLGIFLGKISGREDAFAKRFGASHRTWIFLHPNASTLRYGAENHRFQCFQFSVVRGVCIIDK